MQVLPVHKKKNALFKISQIVLYYLQHNNI